MQCIQWCIQPLYMKPLVHLMQNRNVNIVYIAVVVGWRILDMNTAFIEQKSGHWAGKIANKIKCKESMRIWCIQFKISQTIIENPPTNGLKAKWCAAVFTIWYTSNNYAPDNNNNTLALCLWMYACTCALCSVSKFHLIP